MIVMRGVLIALLLLTACTTGVVNMKIKSTVFEPNGAIPSKYTCQGENINPNLKFEDVPKGTKTLVLLMDDPDVPKYVREDQMWDHWVVFNMPADTKELTEGQIPPGIQGKNTGGAIAYGGPCPPDREHRYFFKLYALDTELSLLEGATKAEVEKAMEGHIIEKAELIGKYVKS